MQHHCVLVGVSHGQRQLSIVWLYHHDRVRPPPQLKDEEELTQQAGQADVGD